MPTNVVPRDTPEACSRLTRFKRRHGVKERRRSPYCICSMIGRRCGRFAECLANLIPPRADHVTHWHRGGRRTSIYVMQPYGWEDDDREALRAFLAPHNLDFYDSLDESWWYPGETTLVAIGFACDFGTSGLRGVDGGLPVIA